MATRTAGGTGTKTGRAGVIGETHLVRNAQITMVPTGQLRLKVTYVRAPTRKTAIVSWPSTRRRPNPDVLTKAEWTRMTKLLMKLCESAFT